MKVKNYNELIYIFFGLILSISSVRGESPPEVETSNGSQPGIDSVLSEWKMPGFYDLDENKRYQDFAVERISANTEISDEFKVIVNNTYARVKDQPTVAPEVWGALLDMEAQKYFQSNKAYSSSIYLDDVVEMGTVDLRGAVQTRNDLLRSAYARPSLSMPPLNQEHMIKSLDLYSSNSYLVNLVQFPMALNDGATIFSESTLNALNPDKRYGGENGFGAGEFAKIMAAISIQEDSSAGSEIVERLTKSGHAPIQEWLIESGESYFGSQFDKEGYLTKLLVNAARGKSSFQLEELLEKVESLHPEIKQKIINEAAVELATHDDMITSELTSLVKAGVELNYYSQTKGLDLSSALMRSGHVKGLNSLFLEAGLVPEFRYNPLQHPTGILGLGDPYIFGVAVDFLQSEPNRKYWKQLAPNGGSQALTNYLGELRTLSPREHNVIEKMLALGADPVFRSTSESQNALEIIAGFERQDSWNCGVCRTKRELLERILRKGSIDQLSLDRALAAAFQGYADTSSYMQKSHDLADMIEVFVSHGANPSTALKYLESSVAAKILEVPGVDLAVQRGVMKYFQNNPQKLATIGKDGFYFTAPNARCEIQSFLQDDDSSNDGLFKLDFYLSAPGAENEQTWKIPVAMNLEGQAVSSESSCLVLSQKFKAQLRKMSQAGEKFKFEYEPVSDEKGAANVLRIVQADGTDNPVTPEVMNQYFLPLQHGGQFSENGARAR